MESARPMDTKVFIGHGHSPEWMKLKDFLTDALDLPCDEFDAVASAGKTIVSRLQEMMTTACFAFLVLLPRPQFKLH